MNTDTDVQTTQVYQLFIKATPERIWQAITDPAYIRQYFHGAEVDTELTAGGRFRTYSPDRSQLWNDSEVLEFDPPRRLAYTWRSMYDAECAAEDTSRVAWEIEPDAGGVCKLTVVHDRLEGAPKTAANVGGAGWMRVISGLKTLLETGEALQ